MAALYLLNGSNVGDRLNHLQNASNLLTTHFGELVASSSVYETQAWGKEDQLSFYNQALQFEHICTTPENILITIKALEKKIGRINNEIWGERVIDIDIVFFGDLIYKSESLQIPHRLMHLRNFVLAPLQEIAADFIHPQFENTVAEILANSTDELQVKKLNTEDAV